MPYIFLVLCCFSLACAVEGKAPLRLVCIGDSITQGLGSSGNLAYPSQLQRLLGEGWAVTNCGVSGSTLSTKSDRPYVRQEAWKRAQETKPQVVIIMLGTNDTKPEYIAHAPGLIDDLTAMVTSLQALESKPRVLLALPCFIVGTGNFGIEEGRLVQYILPAITTVATSKRLQLVDVHAATKAAATTDASLIPDLVHPNDAGYAIIAETMAQALVEKAATKR